MTYSAHTSVAVRGLSLSACLRDPVSSRSAWGHSLDPTQSGDGGGGGGSHAAEGGGGTPGNERGTSGLLRARPRAGGAVARDWSWYRHAQ